MSSQPNNPLHGLTLKAMLEHLVDTLGWQLLADKIRIRCFALDPSVDSSLKFLRRTPWARTKLELLYLSEQGFAIPELKEKPERTDKQSAKQSTAKQSTAKPRPNAKASGTHQSKAAPNAAQPNHKASRGNGQGKGKPNQSREPEQLKGKTLTLNKPSTNKAPADKSSNAAETNSHIWGNPKGSSN